MREFKYILTDQWGNTYEGKVYARNASHAYDEAIKRENSVRDIEEHIMSSYVSPV